MDLSDSGFVFLFHSHDYNAFAVSPDGKRFLIPRPVGGSEIGGGPITVVMNWAAGIKK